VSVKYPFTLSSNVGYLLDDPQFCPLRTKSILLPTASRQVLGTSGSRGLRSVFWDVASPYWALVPDVMTLPGGLIVKRPNALSLEVSFRQRENEHLNSAAMWSV
jgi:hypothetical protein